MDSLSFRMRRLLTEQEVLVCFGRFRRSRFREFVLPACAQLGRNSAVVIDQSRRIVATLRRDSAPNLADPLNFFLKRIHRILSTIGLVSPGSGFLNRALHSLVEYARTYSRWRGACNSMSAECRRRETK